MDLKKLIISETATIVDVRETWEFAGGYVPGSINIPLGEVPHRIDELARMSKPLILICQSGNRSGIAAAMLSARGVSEVYNGGGWATVRNLKMQTA